MKISNNKLSPYVRDEKGRWIRKTRFDLVAFGLVTILILTAYVYREAHAGGNEVMSRDTSTYTISNPVDADGLSTGTNCVKITGSYWQCGDRESVTKWNMYLESQIKKLEAEKPVKIVAIRTRYSRKDSCHNPRGRECLTAIGRDTRENRTVACPRNIKLGTRIMIEGKEYVCEDRYSTYLDAKRGLPTFDVFAEAKNLSALPAYKKVEVSILK